MISNTNRLSLLKEALDKLHKGYGPSYLESDPLLFAHKYTTPEDQEVVGFLAAVFAYGHVPQILRNLRAILTPLSGSVAEAIRKGNASRWKRVYKGYAYRFQREEDLILLLWLLEAGPGRLRLAPGLFPPLLPAVPGRASPRAEGPYGMGRLLARNTAVQPGMECTGEPQGHLSSVARPCFRVPLQEVESLPALDGSRTGRPRSWSLEIHPHPSSDPSAGYPHGPYLRIPQAHEPCRSQLGNGRRNHPNLEEPGPGRPHTI